MTTREEKIHVINEVIARKDLSFGCRVRVRCEEIELEHFTSDDTNTPGLDFVPGFVEGLYGNNDGNLGIRMEVEKIHFDNSNDGGSKVSDAFKNEFRFYETDEGFENLGHPVMIGDVMDYFENIALDKIYNYIGVKKEEIPDLILQKTNPSMMKIFPLWKEKRKSIEEQGDECMDFIYNLIFEKGEK